jgi:hypothetical protein
MTRFRVGLALFVLAVAIDVVAAHETDPATTLANVLTNGRFEEGGDQPDGWAPTVFEVGAVHAWDDTAAHDGIRSVRITAPAPNDAAWLQTVAVQPDSWYILSGWIKTESVTDPGAGANLSVYDTWTHTEGVVGTRDWTRVSLLFRTGASPRLTIAARLGYWGSTAAGTAWFDDIRLVPVLPSIPHPAWKILVLIYRETDFTYTGTDAVVHHLRGAMTAAERARAAESVTRFVRTDIPALTSGNLDPRLTIRYPAHALDRLSAVGEGSWAPGPGDAAPDLDPRFDSVIVIWDPRVLDVGTGKATHLAGGFRGLTWDMGTQPGYTSVIVEAAAIDPHRNVFKHEWGHQILFFHDALGIAPKPRVESHAIEGQYVHCPTAEPYTWVDEYDVVPGPVPNSIYNDESGFTHDTYSGTTALPEEPTRCLGVTPEAWSYGGAVTRGDGNLLRNPGFEVDANHDGRPDAWGGTPSSTWTHVAHSGRHSGRLVGSPDTPATLRQRIEGIGPGVYRFSAWTWLTPACGAPGHGEDPVSLKVWVTWRRADRSVLGRALVVLPLRGGAGGGTWQEAGIEVVAPLGTHAAEVGMAAGGLDPGRRLYVDDTLFRLVTREATAHVPEGSPS